MDESQRISFNPLTGLRTLVGHHQPKKTPTKITHVQLGST